ncbi:hypothetical protein [Streptomyces sp. NBRC 109706]|nr:hypothetical protein [Streptomyces sp. NBRC 109706]
MNAPPARRTWLAVPARVALRQIGAAGPEEPAAAPPAPADAPERAPS